MPIPACDLTAPPPSWHFSPLARIWSAARNRLRSRTSRPSRPARPTRQRKALHVPPGFEIQLVASEPDIHKPLNLAFDDLGRLWVTDTVEYPFPEAGGHAGRATRSRSSPTSAPTAAPARSRPSPTV